MNRTDQGTSLKKKKKICKQLIFSLGVRAYINILESHPFLYIKIPDNIDLTAFLDMLFQ